MDRLAPEDFGDFFHAVWGFSPFPWQQNLLQRLARDEGPHGPWPDVLDLPTGSGKTATLDIAVFHLALEAEKKDQRRAPIRIAFVVDRRLIVDDAFGRAERLSQALGWSLLGDEDAAALETSRPDLAETIRRVRDSAVVRNTALRLLRLAGSDQRPLVARPMRGGAPREDDWARTPVQPTILCSTVDQVGSRLLFRGYGVSDRMKPIHAGLLGSDCLILLDEAHLSEPFRQTLTAVECLRKAPNEHAPFGFAVLTATPAIGPNRPFSLSAADHADPILSARLTAAKPARLVDIAGKQGVDTESRRAEALAQEATAALERLKATGTTAPAVGVVVNRVARARAVFERLDAEFGDTAEVILLIGPARAVDRDKLAQKLDPIRTRQPDTQRRLSAPLVVVATQTIEAGVDIDFDGLVTEAAALDALRQRFGRLNRAGRSIKPAAAILAHKDDVSAKADDPVYGDRIRATWERLRALAAPDDVIDFGGEALKVRIDQDAARLASPLENAPVLMPAYADLWSQTSPIPNADPDVALFLHGRDRSPASVQIVWRADVDEESDLRPAMEQEGVRERLIALLALVPPRAAEAVEVPLWAARNWLNRRETSQADFSDAVESSPDTDEFEGIGRSVFRWAGEDSERTRVVYASDLRNGDLVVVPADYGGCDKWGWNPKEDASVVDVAERAAWPYRTRRFAIRVTPKLIEQGLQEESRAPDPDLAERLGALLAEFDRSEELLDAVQRARFVPDSLKSLLAAFEQRPRELKHEFAYGLDDVEDRPRGVVFFAPGGLKGPVEDLSAVPATEDDDLGAKADRPVPLLDHSKHVRNWAKSFAAQAGLPLNLQGDIALAAYLHDAGKADPRYQAYYAGGSPYGPDLTAPLAKSGQMRLPRGAWERAGLPCHWRHEALSVRLAPLHSYFVRAHDRELVLWLIGTHHGCGRPLFPHADPRDGECRSLGLPGWSGATLRLEAGAGPQSLAFDFNGHDWAQLFETLKRKYGTWGLARLEALIRLADHRASDSEPASSQRVEDAAE
ncbi:MAG: type I-U CRISPR-associated helicase/endonuclease Cas3 [Xanthobacteraceae bacterium]|nr:type I-U CRISPR-associated helicase/endonuclease Cas3 [Xanthobacteraceae bacterium]